MAVESLSVPDEWLIEELLRPYQERPDLVHSFLRNLLNESEEFRWSLAVRAYQARRINLVKTAEFLGLYELELRERFLEFGISLRLGPADACLAVLNLAYEAPYQADSLADSVSSVEPEESLLLAVSPPIGSLLVRGLLYVLGEPDLRWTTHPQFRHSRL